MTKTLSQEEARKLIENADMAESTIQGISKLLVKSGIPIDQVLDSLIAVATNLSHFHHQGDWKDFVIKCAADNVKQLDDRMKENK